MKIEETRPVTMEAAGEEHDSNIEWLAGSLRPLTQKGAGFPGRGETAIPLCGQTKHVLLVISTKGPSALLLILIDDYYCCYSTSSIGAPQAVMTPSGEMKDMFLSLIEKYQTHACYARCLDVCVLSFKNGGDIAIQRRTVAWVRRALN